MAYELRENLGKALRDASTRYRVPMPFVTSEPHVGQPGLDGGGDTWSLPESDLRQHQITWLGNARFDRGRSGKHHASAIAADAVAAAPDRSPFYKELALHLLGFEKLREFNLSDGPAG